MAKSVLEAIREGDWFFEPQELDSNRFPATPAIPGTREKLDVLAERASAGLPLWHAHDRPDYEEPVISQQRAVGDGLAALPVDRATFFDESTMPKFSVQVPHSLGQQAARERLERLGDVLKEKFRDQVSELEQNWEGDTLQFRLKTYGILLQGGVTVDDEKLDLAGELPFSAMMFKGKIESAIREQLEKLVSNDQPAK